MEKIINENERIVEKDDEFEIINMEEEIVSEKSTKEEKVKEEFKKTADLSKDVWTNYVKKLKLVGDASYEHSEKTPWDGQIWTKYLTNL